jgi:hypothetical protein
VVLLIAASEQSLAPLLYARQQGDASLPYSPCHSHKQAFEDLWVKYAGGKARMTPRDVINVVVASASPSNPFGA